MNFRTVLKSVAGYVGCQSLKPCIWLWAVYGARRESPPGHYISFSLSWCPKARPNRLRHPDHSSRTNASGTILCPPSHEEMVRGSDADKDINDRDVRKVIPRQNSCQNMWPVFQAVKKLSTPPGATRVVRFLAYITDYSILYKTHTTCT